MITGINESKTLTKYISWWCKCKVDGRKCNSNQECKTINVDAGTKTYIWNPALCSCWRFSDYVKHKFFFFGLCKLPPEIKGKIYLEKNIRAF